MQWAARWGVTEARWEAWDAAWAWEGVVMVISHEDREVQVRAADLRGLLGAKTAFTLTHVQVKTEGLEGFVRQTNSVTYESFDLS